MRTTIGRQLGDSHAARIYVGLFGGLVLAADLSVVAWMRYPLRIDARWSIAIAAVIVLWLLVRGDAASVGIVPKPIQGWDYWVRMAVLIGVAVLAIITATIRVWMLLEREVPAYVTPPSAFGTRFLSMCVFAPLQEEVIYRMVLCVSIVRLIGKSGTVLASGAVFGFAHVVYGNPSPENLVGGFFLGWCYLKSGTILIPLLLHSLGNLCVLLGQVEGWHLVH